MDVLGDAEPLVFDGALALDHRHAPGVPAALDQPDEGGDQRRDADPCEGAEPGGLPEFGEHPQGDAGAAFAPAAAAVAGCDLKPIVAGRQMAVFEPAAVAGVIAGPVDDRAIAGL